MIHKMEILELTLEDTDAAWVDELHGVKINLRAGNLSTMENHFYTFLKRMDGRIYITLTLKQRKKISNQRCL